MPFAIVVFFEEPQSKIFDDTIEELAIKDVAPFMFNESSPHITLAIYDELDCDKCKDEIEIYSNKLSEISFKFSHLGLFNTRMNAIVAAPTVTSDLLKMHKEFHDHFNEFGVGSWHDYLPGNWVPHCTLAFNVDNNKLDEAFSICRKIKFPFEISTSSIGVMEFEPVREIYRIPFLKNNSAKFE